MPYDLWALYGKMLRYRLYEEVVIEFWEEGLVSAELAAIALEAGLPIKFKRICTSQTIPYARYLED